MTIDHVLGVDFSGAKLAGLNIWIARLAMGSRKPVLVALDRLGTLAGSMERESALAHLVRMIGESNNALWGIDFPFALPIELVDAKWGFAEQLDWVAKHTGTAYTFGHECLDRARRVGDKLHIRRDTDKETKTPFDCYHYRIICQTFHGMRDVLRPLHRTSGTAIVPFDAPRDSTRRAVAEACPGSTLKRWHAPHNNYKQPAGGPLEAKRLRNRRLILDQVRARITISDTHLRVIQRNPGGDALDAVLAGIGAWESWQTTDPAALSAHPRYPREGRIFA